MTIYSGPSREREYYRSKFIRVGNDIHVTNPDDRDTLHNVLADQDGVLEQFNSLLTTSPNEVDGGLIIVNNNTGTISLSGKSSTLKVPISEAARDRSVVVFQAQTHGYTVKKV